MRSQLVARRFIVAPVLALTLAAAVAACSSSSSSGSSSTGATSAPASSAPASSAPTSTPVSGNSAAVAQITANWEKFFNSSTPNSERVALLQNGNAFSGAISGLISLAPGLASKVANVTVNSATSATVIYNLTAGGTSLFPSNQTGKAVYENGVWKVGDASLCSLLRLVPGGTVPAACNSAS
jgi:purine-cytosine permease-like protein